MHFARSLLRDATYFSVATMLLTSRAPDLSADNVWLRWRADATFASPVLADPRMAVVGGPDETTSVATDDELYRWFAERYVAGFAPLLDALHQHTRVGRRILWGYVADSVGFRMLMVARDVGWDMGTAWTRGQLVTEALRAAGAPISSGPRPFPIGAPSAARLWAVRGVCCFDYKSDPEHGYCVTCPLATDDSRCATFHELAHLPPTT